ncbi:flavin-containing amine oxidoreductase [Colletotrichum zoysiae]|uniref:Amine oxidase n=1 Tax=Colletotrichum zoysiae TaxID=1216348 RepID=A0AAD9H470_9PEZI|nr:flavin-containing amine oxidoreductase [Colletotrichum zoysiae]
MAPKVRALDLDNTSTAYYAPATVAPPGAKLVHVSGQPGNTKDGLVPDDYESQIHLALLNLRKIILVAGASVKDIVKLTLLVVDYDSSARKHTRHVQRFLGGHRPAITLIPVSGLAVPSWLFEIEAVLAVPESPAPARRLDLPDAEESVDVIVIGAGLAGLSAARDVLKSGLSCVVLEARDRVGGKTWSEPLQHGQPGVVDLGAAWINDTNQSRVYALAKEYGAELIEQNTNGNVVLQDFDGKCSPFPYGELPFFDEATRKALAGIRDMVEADCQAVDTWKPKDTSLDSLTFAAYLRLRGADDVAAATANVWTCAMLGQEATDVSALYFLNYCKSGGGLLQMRSDRRDGGQYLRVRQGTQLFSRGLASSLPEGVVRLNRPVRAVVRDGHPGVGGGGGRYAVKVQTDEGVLAARKVITTIPGPALKSISFQPALPLPKQAWIESLSYGYYTKAMMQFESPFWVERGFCGLAQSFVGPASVVRDTSVPADSKHVLTCFVAGDRGRAWAALDTPAAREESLLAQLAQLFGCEDVRGRFVRMSTYEWVRDEWSGWGCPCTSLAPGVLDALGGDGLRKPCGDLHFAGTETAGEWKGYMEGAVRSGERAAAEVIEALTSTSGASRL